MAFGEVFKETLILESGSNRKHMAKAYTSGKTEIVTRESGKTVSNMAQGPTNSSMAMFTPGNINLENLMATGSLPGQMGLFILVVLRMGRSTASDDGDLIEHLRQPATKDCSRTT